MTKTIDVTGLPPEAVEAVETLVGMLRAGPPSPPRESMFDLFGSVPVLRTGEDIARQIQEEHDSWGEP
ncbi:MAG TPA: hypothetical protein VH092_00730 [Urbifossiella sp.]|jgi:hypothetical protein|nr:hypothetical protein [Urbifossiella sp.]